MLVRVSEKNVQEAAAIHSLSWKDSHKAFCSKDFIENLYVLPKEQHKGYGTKLLLFAISKCKSQSMLWILDNNKRAYNLYYKYGFRKTGKINVLSDTISETEMKKMDS